MKKIDSYKRLRDIVVDGGCWEFVDKDVAYIVKYRKWFCNLLVMQNSGHGRQLKTVFGQNKIEIKV